MHTQFLIAGAEALVCPLTVVTHGVGVGLTGGLSMQLKDGIMFHAMSVDFANTDDVRLFLRNVQIGIGLFADEARTTFVDYINLNNWQGAFEPPAPGQGLSWSGELRLIQAGGLPQRANWAFPVYDVGVRNSDGAAAHTLHIALRALVSPLI